METTVLQLERVQKAIAAIEEGAQEYTIDGSNRVTRADLATLYKREETLIAKLADEEYGSVTYAQIGMG